MIPAEISSQQVVGPKRPNEYVTLSRVFSSATHTQLRMCNLLTAATKFKPNSGKQNFLCSHRVFPRKSSSLSSNVNETFFVVSKSFLTVIKSLLEVQRTKKNLVNQVTGGYRILRGCIPSFTQPKSSEIQSDDTALRRPLPLAMWFLQKCVTTHEERGALDSRDCQCIGSPRVPVSLPNTSP